MTKLWAYEINKETERTEEFFLNLYLCRKVAMVMRR